MPYDPRPVSQGGNAGIDEEFSRKAPKGKFRLVTVDTFDGTDEHNGDFDTLEDAQDAAKRKTKGQQMCMAHIYNDKGHRVGDRGTF